MLSQNNQDAAERQQILQYMEETSIRATAFAEASYRDRDENYPFDTLSPYLPYSLCQAAIIQYRLWIQNSSPIHKRNLDSLKSILREFTKRWMVACESICTG